MEAGRDAVPVCGYTRADVQLLDKVRVALRAGSPEGAREGHHVPGGGAPGVVRGAPGSDRSAARGAELRVIVRRKRIRVAWS